MSKILSLKVSDRIKVEVSHLMSNVEGIMTFGETNDNPQLMERLISGSPTGVASSSMLSRFIAGKGFEAPINDIIIGKDEKGKDITVLRLLRSVARSVARFNGYYLHTMYQIENKDSDNPKIEPVITKIRNVPFKKARFCISDDNNYSPFIFLYDNWDEDYSEFKYKFGYNYYSQTYTDKKNVVHPVRYNIFNPNADVLISQVNAGNFRGQIFHDYFNDEYFYPLSIFDSVAYDLDTEAQISKYRNNELRNGLTEKTFIGLSRPSNETEEKEIIEDWENQQGADGDKVAVYWRDKKEDGEFEDGIKVDTINSNIDSEMFANWEDKIASKIRMCAENIPSVLITDADNNSKLGTTSGEAFKLAVHIYNANTEEKRSNVAKSLAQVLKLFNDSRLQNNENWNIEPLNLSDFENQTGSTQANND
jgi:hypothetical protein